MNIPGSQKGPFVQIPPHVVGRVGSLEHEPKSLGVIEQAPEADPTIQEVREHPAIAPEVSSILLPHPTITPSPQAMIDAYAGKEIPLSPQLLAQELQRLNAASKSDSGMARILLIGRWLKRLIRSMVPQKMNPTMQV